jgi:hypothetical protein
MSDFFADAGAWIDQAGKDTGEWINDAQDTLVNEVVFGDAANGIIDVLKPNNSGPSPDEIVDQIESTMPNSPSPSPDEIVDQIESTIPNNPSPGPDDIVDQIESTIDQQPTPDVVVGPDFNNPVPELPSPIVGPDFNNPVPELPSPGFKTFDPLTNPSPGLESSAFEFGEVGVDALSIDSTNGAEIRTITTDAMFATYDPLTNPNPIFGGDGFKFGEVGFDAHIVDSTYGAQPQGFEELMMALAPGLVPAGPAGGYDFIDALNGSLFNSFFEVAETPTF